MGREEKHSHPEGKEGKAAAEGHQWFHASTSWALPGVSRWAAASLASGVTRRMGRWRLHSTANVSHLIWWLSAVLMKHLGKPVSQRLCSW